MLRSFILHTYKNIHTKYQLYFNIMFTRNIELRYNVVYKIKSALTKLL